MNETAIKPEIAAEQLKDMQAFYRVFTSKDGERILNWIVNYRQNLMDRALTEKDRKEKLPLIDQATGVDSVLVLIGQAVKTIEDRKEAKEKESK